MAGHPQLALQPGDSGSMVQMAHRNRWFTFLNSMVIFHGEVLVITRWYFFKTYDLHQTGFSEDLREWILIISSIFIGVLLYL